MASLNYATLPSFPNYRLGRLEGSPCDTLNLVNTQENPAPKEAIQLFPNPTDGVITLEGLDFLQMDGQLVIYNQIGQQVATFVLQKGQQVHNFTLPDDLPNGIYFYSVFQKGTQVGKGKLVTARK